MLIRLWLRLTMRLVFGLPVLHTRCRVDPIRIAWVTVNYDDVQTFPSSLTQSVCYPLGDPSLGFS
jgi:hypothetical protein